MNEEPFVLSRLPVPPKREPWRPLVEPTRQLVLLERMNDDPAQQGLFPETEDGPRLLKPRKEDQDGAQDP
jgi:hypothetical protein